METITFYSYKGGVGRTLALANIAEYLSRFRQNVCIIDFDLEAPSLHYKFPRLIEAMDIKNKKGLIDCIYECTRNKDKLQSLELLDSLDLGDFTIELRPFSKSRGGIRLIPAGDNYSQDYWRKLTSINWYNLFYENDKKGIDFFRRLKKKIKDEFKPDFLLIDSRTGVTEMGGVCTSIFPDKVVFLFANNRENLEGAFQILHGIQRVERLPGEKPIEVTFAAARIPFPDSEEGKEEETKLIKEIQDFLYTKGQLNAQSISILHSDRELELSESLRIGSEVSTIEKPLTRDYLGLFRKIIPADVISSERDNVIDELTTAQKLLEDPDIIQEQLEAFVVECPYPRSYEKLIELYILRNVERKKLLNTFHMLWGTFGIDSISPKILSKYVSIFMKTDLDSWKKSEFELAIIEEYLKSDPNNRIDIEKKLAEAYKRYNRPKMALKYYISILEYIKDKIGILREIFDIISIDKESYDHTLDLFNKYSDIIESNKTLMAKKVVIMFSMGNIEEVKKLLGSGGIIEKTLSEQEPSKYVYIMNTIGKSEEANKKLNSMLNDALISGNAERIFNVGTIFYGLGRADEFINKVIDRHSQIKDIVYYLNEGIKKFPIVIESQKI